MNKFYNKFQKILSIIIFISLFTGFINKSTAQKQDNLILCVGNYQTEKEAMQQLKRISASYTNLEEWEKRAAIIREGILEGAELSPLPQKENLNSISRDQRDYNGYSVLNILKSSRMTDS